MKLNCIRDFIVKACCVLDNYVRKRDGYKFEDTFFNNLDFIQNYGNAGVRHEGIDVRKYFVNVRSVPFQYRFT